MRNASGSEEPEGIRKKVCHASLEDGMPEILLGLFFVWYGGFLVLARSRFGTNYPVAPLAILFTFSAFTLEAVRRRIARPRTGRFKARGMPGKVFIAAWVVFVLVPFTIYLALIFDADTMNIARWQPLLPSLFGVAVAGILREFAIKSGERQFVAFTVFSLVSGLAFSRQGFSRSKDGVALFFSARGGMAMLSGAVLLEPFIRTAPLQEGEVNVQA